MIDALLDGEPPVRLEFWDGSALGPTTARDDPDQLARRAAADRVGARRARVLAAFVAGDIDVDGRSPRCCERCSGDRPPAEVGRRAPRRASRRDAPARVLKGRSPRRRRRRSCRAGSATRSAATRRRSATTTTSATTSTRLVLGPSMTYSCARFVSDDTTLEDAQAAKHELICRKLGLDRAGVRAASVGERPRLLDVGCGWGSMAIHAASHHDVDVVGVTISDEQAARPASASPRPASPTASRSASRTTARSTTARTTRSPRSGWPNTSA